MVKLKLYPNCTRLIGERKSSYITRDDLRTKPMVRSCHECDRYNKCLEQYFRFHTNCNEECEKEKEPAGNSSYVWKYGVWKYVGKKKAT